MITESFVKRTGIIMYMNNIYLTHEEGFVLALHLMTNEHPQIRSVIYHIVHLIIYLFSIKRTDKT